MSFSASLASRRAGKRQRVSSFSFHSFAPLDFHLFRGSFVLEVCRACLHPSRDMRCEIWRHSACQPQTFGYRFHLRPVRYCERDAPRKKVEAGWGLKLETSCCRNLTQIELVRVARPSPAAHDIWQTAFCRLLSAAGFTSLEPTLNAPQTPSS